MYSRKCTHCGNFFGSEIGLKNHCTRNRTGECGRNQRNIEKAKKIKIINARRHAMKRAKMSDIGPHIKNISSKHKRGAPLSKGEKEFVCYIYDQCISKFYEIHTVLQI